MKLTTGMKLGLGFTAVLALMVISATVAYFKIAEMNHGVGKLADQAFPAVAACDDMLTNLNLAVAAQRGYVILGDDPQQAAFFKDERASSWKGMEEALARLTELYKNSTDANDKKNLAAVQSELEGLPQGPTRCRGHRAHRQERARLRAVAERRGPAGGEDT